MYGYLYILQSEKSGRYYIGSAMDPERRLTQHNNNAVKSTRSKGPWLRVALYKFSDIQRAKQAELYLKKQKSREATQSVIEGSFNWPEKLGASV